MDMDGPTVRTPHNVSRALKVGDSQNLNAQSLTARLLDPRRLQTKIISSRQNFASYSSYDNPTNYS